MTEPSGTRDNPVWMKIIHDEDGIKWANLIVMLGLTALSGYLAARAQRAGSNPDLGVELRLKIAAAGERLGNEITKVGVALSISSARAYDRARSV